MIGTPILSCRRTARRRYSSYGILSDARFNHSNNSVFHLPRGKKHVLWHPFDQQGSLRLCHSSGVLSKPGRRILVIYVSPASSHGKVTYVLENVIWGPKEGLWEKTRKLGDVHRKVQQGYIE